MQVARGRRRDPRPRGAPHRPPFSERPRASPMSPSCRRRQLSDQLSPWLGGDLSIGDIPRAALIDADLDVPKNERDARVAALDEAVKAINKSARVEPHARYLAPLARLVGAIGFLAFGLVALMGAGDGRRGGAGGARRPCGRIAPRSTSCICWARPTIRWSACSSGAWCWTPAFGAAVGAGRGAGRDPAAGGRRSMP